MKQNDGSVVWMDGKKDGSIRAEPLLHFMLIIILIRLAEALPCLTESSRNIAPATALPAPGGTQRCSASAHNAVRALFSHRHNLGMIIKLKHFMGE